MGGISSAHDVIEMMVAGASAVAIGCQNLVDPYACYKIIQDLPKELEKLGVEDINDIVGIITSIKREMKDFSFSIIIHVI